MALRRREELWYGGGRKREGGGEKNGRKRKKEKPLSLSVLSLSFTLKTPPPLFLTRLLRHARDQALYLLLPGPLRGAAVQVGVKKEKKKKRKEREKNIFFCFGPSRAGKAQRPTPRSLSLPVSSLPPRKERERDNCVAAFVLFKSTFHSSSVVSQVLWLFCFFKFFDKRKKTN